MIEKQKQWNRHETDSMDMGKANMQLAQAAKALEKLKTIKRTSKHANVLGRPAKQL